MKEMEDELNEKLNFLSGFAAAFKEQIHADILVKPGTDEPSLPAHRALLVILFFVMYLLFWIVDRVECNPVTFSLQIGDINFVLE